MSVYQKSFKRLEKKYIISEYQEKKLVGLLGDRLLADKYCHSTICNIYYDTVDSRLIRASLQKPVYKEKFRIRCYGVPKEDDTAFAEIKKKYKGIVYKRRAAMSYDDAVNYMKSNQTNGDSQILREIDYFKQFYKTLQPKMVITYDRSAFSILNENELRITFDRNILWRDYDLDLKRGIYGERILDEGKVLMELKTPDAIPLWLCRILGDLNIIGSSFSKYGTAYENSCSEQNKGGNVSA